MAVPPEGHTLTAGRLRELLHYDLETGIFTWRICLNSRVPVGTIVLGRRADGYVRIQIDGKRYLAHRLAWLHVTGAWPRAHIDHINCDPSDNRFSNLREATDAENGRNRGYNINNTSGFKGVSYNKRARKYVASIKVDGKQKHLGTFYTAEAAHEAYCAAARDLHVEFRRTA